MISTMVVVLDMWPLQEAISLQPLINNTVINFTIKAESCGQCTPFSWRFMTPGIDTIEEIPPCLNFDLDLVEQRYYHGLLPRDDVLYLLQKDGDFLVRITEANSLGERIEMVLSTLYDPQGCCKPKLGQAVEEDNLKVRIKRPVSLASWEFTTKDFLLGESIGKAGCIELRKGLIQKEKEDIEASVTTVVGRSPEAKVTILELMRQCRMLRDLHHPCIVQFYGVCLISQPCCFLMEYLSEGPLDDFLIKRRGSMKRDELLQMMMSAGWGLDFLHANGILHRDLAARNCFYDKQLVKISGFGLARKTQTYSLKSMRRMAVRWMAPETLVALRFSQKTDVYSYGVLIYEIFSQCEPYEGISNQDVKALILRGRVNEFPAKTPRKLAEFVAEKLWNVDPKKRPTMEKTLQWLSHYTGIKLQIATMGTNTPIVHQNFGAPVLKDVDFREVADDNTMSKLRKMSPMTASSPKARTPRANTPRASTPRSRTPRGGGVKVNDNVRTGSNDNVVMSPIKRRDVIKAVSAGDGGTQDGRPRPSCDPQPVPIKLKNSPQNKSPLAEYENLATLGAMIPKSAPETSPGAIKDQQMEVNQLKQKRIELPRSPVRDGTRAVSSPKKETEPTSLITPQIQEKQTGEPIEEGKWPRKSPRSPVTDGTRAISSPKKEPIPISSIEPQIRQKQPVEHTGEEKWPRKSPVSREGTIEVEPNLRPKRELLEEETQHQPRERKLKHTSPKKGDVWANEAPTFPDFEQQ